MVQIAVILLLLLAVATLISFSVRLSFRRRRQLEPISRRIRQEVLQEYQSAVKQATGLRRIWLVLRREYEISRRYGQLIFGR